MFVSPKRNSLIEGGKYDININGQDDPVGCGVFPCTYTMMCYRCARHRWWRGCNCVGVSNEVLRRSENFVVVWLVSVSRRSERSRAVRGSARSLLAPQQQQKNIKHVDARNADTSSVAVVDVMVVRRYSWLDG